MCKKKYIYIIIYTHEFVRFHNYPHVGQMQVLPKHRRASNPTGCAGHRVPYRDWQIDVNRCCVVIMCIWVDKGSFVLWYTLILGFVEYEYHCCCSTMLDRSWLSVNFYSLLSLTLLMGSSNKITKALGFLPATRRQGNTRVHMLWSTFGTWALPYHHILIVVYFVVWESSSNVAFYWLCWLCQPNVSSLMWFTLTHDDICQIDSKNVCDINSHLG